MGYQTQQVAEAKRAQTEAHLATALPYDPSLHNEYLRATVKDVTDRIQRGEWNASAVLEAYIARATYAHRQTNCLTEILFERGRKIAKGLDEEFAQTKKLKGPLHGVPISFKDQINFVDVDTTIGLSQRAGQKPVTDANIVTQIIEAGGIPFVKTNVPQTLLAFECCNPVFGRTLNPYNDAYTCGGSSGGEAALLRMDGSLVGIGTDIGGSLRIPALYSGIYSLKPGTGRVSMRGVAHTSPGYEGIIPTAGPMGRSVSDLELIAKLVFGKGEDVAPVPFRETELPFKLKFGYYTSDYYVKTSPACQRAVLETVKALQKQGHECIEVDFPADLGVEAFNVFAGLGTADGYKSMVEGIGPDPKEESVFLPTLTPKIPGPIRALAGWIITKLIGDPIFASSLAVARVKPMHEYMEFVVRRGAVEQCFKEEIWDKYGLDGLISPVQAIPQLPHGGCKFLSPLASPTILYNVLNYPAGVIPVTHVDPAIDEITEQWRLESGHGSKIVEGRVYNSTNPVYDAKKMEGMPVGIQISALRWQDEKVLGMMHVIDHALGPRQFGPGAFNLRD